jgi:hypothetical protein
MLFPQTVIIGRTTTPVTSFHSCVYFTFLCIPRKVGSNTPQISTPVTIRNLPHHPEGKVRYNLRAIKTFGKRHVCKLPERNLRGRQS